MTIQALTHPTAICHFLLAPTEPVHASSRDYGFDFDEEELGQELLAPLPATLSIPSSLEVAEEEFDSPDLLFGS